MGRTFPSQTSWWIELVSMLTNSPSPCLSNPEIVASLVGAGLVTRLRRWHPTASPGHTCAEFDVASPLVDGKDGNSLAPIILNRQHAARKRRLPLPRCFRWAFFFRLD